MTRRPIVRNVVQAALASAVAAWVCGASPPLAAAGRAAAPAASDTTVIDAVRSGSVERLRAALRPGVDVNTPQGDGATALHWAVHRNDVAAVDLLLRASTRSEAVQIAKDLGLHGVDLKSNPRPPRKDDLTALLASGQPLLWRDFTEGSKWQPRITLPHIK